MMIETLRVLKVSAPRCCHQTKVPKGMLRTYGSPGFHSWCRLRRISKPWSWTYMKGKQLVMHIADQSRYEVWDVRKRRIVDCATPMCWEDGYGLGMSWGPAGLATVGVTTSQQWNISWTFWKESRWFLIFLTSNMQMLLSMIEAVTLPVQTLVISATVKAQFQVLQNGNGEACSGWINTGGSTGSGVCLSFRCSKSPDAPLPLAVRAKVILTCSDSLYMGVVQKVLVLSVVFDDLWYAKMTFGESQKLSLLK